MRVLVVEESAGQGATVAEALRRAGCEVSLAPGVVAETLERVGPDLVVMSAASLGAILEALATTSRRLEERKLIERAKGLLMKCRGLDEDAAYAALRKMAMDRSLRLAEVAQHVLKAADSLGA